MEATVAVEARIKPTYVQPGDRPTLFESQVCGRCCGSGEYSYCQMYGKTCFKCAGRGRVLTKRGLAAQNYLHTPYSKHADEIAVGECFFIRGFSAGSYSQPSKFFKVIASRADKHNTGHWILEADETQYGTACDSMVRVGQTRQQKTEKIALALAYQATLTQKGVASKKATK